MQLIHKKNEKQNNTVKLLKIFEQSSEYPLVVGMVKGENDNLI